MDSLVVGLFVVLVAPVSLCFSIEAIRSMYGTDLRNCYLVILPCTMEVHPHHILARICWFSQSSYSGVEHLLPGYANIAPSASYNQQYADLFVLSDIDARKVLQFALMKTIYVPHPSRSAIDRSPPDVLEHGFDLDLSSWSRAVLERQGYNMTRLKPDIGKPSYTYHLVLSKRGISINILIQYDRSVWSDLCSWGLVSGAAWISHTTSKDSEGQNLLHLCRHRCQTFEYDTGSGAQSDSGFPEVRLEGALGESFTLFLSLETTQGSSIPSSLGIEVVEPEGFAYSDSETGKGVV